MARMRLAARSSLPADEVDHLLFDRIEEQAVDGEVAARGVLLGGAESDAVGMPAVAIGGVTAEGRHLDHACRLGPEHRNHSEGGADGQGAPVAEKLADLLGHGVGGHVIVLGRAAEELVADAAAGPIGLEAGPAQAANHLGGETALFLGQKHSERPHPHCSQE